MEPALYPELKNVLTVSQCARRLMLPDHRVRKLIRAKVLPAIRVGWMFMIRVRDIEVYERERGA